MFCPKCKKELDKQEIKISRWTGNKSCKHCRAKLTKLSGFSIASLILAIPIFGILGFLLAIIFGIIALVRISKNKEKLVGRSMAITGLSVGSFFILFPLVVILILPIFSTCRVKQAKKESQKLEKEVQKLKDELNEILTKEQELKQKLNIWPDK